MIYKINADTGLLEGNINGNIINLSTNTQIKSKRFIQKVIAGIENIGFTVPHEDFKKVIITFN